MSHVYVSYLICTLVGIIRSFKEAILNFAVMPAIILSLLKIDSAA